MQVDQETLRKIAHLSRLDLEVNTEKDLIGRMNRILTWMEKLNEIDTSEVEPLTHMSEEVNVLREDEVKPPLPHDRGLYNAPKKDADYFRVPKVLE
jgi:aspartyl-tRNA(Asn)/glutamyl-tRNA(Gln) amidotransferase subunit C